MLSLRRLSLTWRLVTKEKGRILKVVRTSPAVWILANRRGRTVEWSYFVCKASVNVYVTQIRATSGQREARTSKVGWRNKVEPVSQTEATVPGNWLEEKGTWITETDKASSWITLTLSMNLERKKLHLSFPLCKKKYNYFIALNMTEIQHIFQLLNHSSIAEIFHKRMFFYTIVIDIKNTFYYHQ